MTSRRASVIGPAVIGLCLAAGHAGAQQRQPGPGRDAGAVVTVAPGDDWRSQATARDRQRIDTLPAAWAEALESARHGGHMPAVAAAGALVDSRPAGDGALPGVGFYRCRAIRLGAVDPEGAGFVAYPPFRCQVRVQAGVTVFEKFTGSQRIAGAIIPDGPARAVLVGTEAAGPEAGFAPYGQDAARDRIATVERLAPDRWRLVFPRPSNGAIIEVMELVGPAVSAAPAPPSSPAPARSGTSRRG